MPRREETVVLILPISNYWDVGKTYYPKCPHHKSNDYELFLPGILKFLPGNCGTTAMARWKLKNSVLHSFPHSLHFNESSSSSSKV